MSASDHLQPLQFNYNKAGPDVHHITAVHQGNEVGTMRWAANKTKHGPAGEILELRVSPEHRRKGVATNMYNYSKQFEQPATHSAKRTPKGNAFAKSTGDKVPPLRKKLPDED